MTCRVAIIEPNHSHEEVILPQVELLKSRYEIAVVAPSSLLENELLRDTSGTYQGYPFKLTRFRSRLLRAAALPFKYLAIRRIIERVAPHIIIFNSTYTLAEVALIAFLFRSYKKIQIIHNFKQFLSFFGKYLYRRFSANLVISDDVWRYITQRHPEFSTLDFFLPIFFDSFMAEKRGNAKRGASGCRVVKLGVFGSIEPRRRNYYGLLEALARLDRVTAESTLHVYLVGKAPPEIIDFITQHQLQNIVTIYHAFVPFHEMFRLLEEVDAVLFLIDSQVAYADQYNRYKISGTSTLMKAFKKVGCTSTDFRIDECLADACWTYEGDQIEHFLNRILDGTLTVETLRMKAMAYDGLRDLMYERQQERLVSVIENVLSS